MPCGEEMSFGRNDRGWEQKRAEREWAESGKRREREGKGREEERVREPEPWAPSELCASRQNAIMHT